MSEKAMSSATGASGGYAMQQKTDSHDGVMLAFKIPSDLGQQLQGLAVQSGFPADCLLPIDDMHITLVYLGDVQDAPGSDSENIAGELESFLPGWEQISGSINGAGRFVDHPDQDCIYLNFDAPDLPRFRESLIAFLNGADVTPVITHGFTPHMTIGYIDKSVPTPTIPLEPQAVSFTSIMLAYGDERYELPFGKRSAEGEKALPYKVIEREDKYYVENESTGELTPKDGYTDRAEAENYHRALEANVPDAKAQDDLTPPTPQPSDGSQGPDEPYTNEVNEELDPTEGTAWDLADAEAEKSAEGHYAYPEESKLPMPDAQHVILAAAAMGPNPPHGHGAKIPGDQIAKVRAKIRARAHELGMSKEEIAKVNAYLSGHTPKDKMAEKDIDPWSDLYDKVFTQTGDEEKAALAAQGAINKRRIVGRKAGTNGLPTTVGGWAMIFTGPDDLDLQETYFSKMTRTLVEYYPNAPLWYEHGVDARYGADPIGKRTLVEVYPYGIYMEHELDTRHPLYARTAKDAADGLLSYSSDSLSHYVAQGYDPDDGHLGEWPLAGCSLTRKPAEPGLGPVQAKSLEVALKSVVQKREADDQAKRAQTNLIRNAKMDPNENFETPETEVEATPASTFEALAQMYNCVPEEVAVRAAMDDHIELMRAEGKADPALCKALGMDENTPVESVSEKLNNLYSGAMSEKDDMPMDTPEPVMAVRHNYDVLSRALQAGVGTPKARGVYLTAEMGKKGINIVGRAPKPSARGMAVDLMRMRYGLDPKYCYNSKKAMSSATGPNGGYIMHQEIAPTVLDPLRASVICISLGATTVDMQGTNVLTQPIMNSAPPAYWTAENQAVTSGQPAYRVVTLYPRGLSCLVQIPFNVEANMTPQADQQLRTQMAKSLALKIDLAALVGTGGADSSGVGTSPVGILNTPSVQTYAFGSNGRVPQFLDIVNAFGLMDDANVPNDESSRRGIAMHSQISRAFTGQTDSLGNPLLRPSWARVAEKDIIGVPYALSTQIPTTVTTGTSTNSSYIFVGDWAYMYIGLSDQVELRLDQTYAGNLQAGLLAYVYADVKIVYPSAFVVMSGVLPPTIAGVTSSTNTLN